MKSRCGLHWQFAWSNDAIDQVIRICHPLITHLPGWACFIYCFSLALCFEPFWNFNPFCSFHPCFHLIWCHPWETHLPRMHKGMLKTQACWIIKIRWTVWNGCQCACQVRTSSRQQADNMSQPVATYCRNATSKCWTFRKKTYTGKHSFWVPRLCQNFPC